MLKKIILSGLLVSVISILVWGGVNRTLAKTNPNEGGNGNNQSSEYYESVQGSGIQPRGNDNQGQGNNLQSESAKGNSANPNGIGDGSGTTDTQSQTQGNGNRGGGGYGNGQGSGQGGGSDPLTATEIEALNLALDDEYHALAVYQAVIAKFGEVEPFVEIAASEQRHINALINQFEKHGLALPENPWIGNVLTFNSLQEACQVGVEAEIANADLYAQLFRMTEDPSLTRVFTNLSNASLNSHLPQFEACQ